MTNEKEIDVIINDTDNDILELDVSPNSTICKKVRGKDGLIANLCFSPTALTTYIAHKKIEKAYRAFNSRFDPNKDFKIIEGMWDGVDELFGDGAFDFLTGGELNENALTNVQKVMDWVKTVINATDKKLDKHVMSE